MIFLVPNASRTCESACETWQKRRSVSTARFVTASSTSLSLMRASSVVDRGSKIPSRVNMRQKSGLGVGDCYQRGPVSHTNLEIKYTYDTVECGKNEGFVGVVIFVEQLDEDLEATASAVSINTTLDERDEHLQSQRTSSEVLDECGRLEARVGVVLLAGVWLV